MSHQIQRLLPTHFMILDLVLAGHTRTAIAELVGRTPESVGMVIGSPIFQNELTRRRRETQREGTDTLSRDRDRILGKARSILDQAAADAAET
jgi:hypothetical protein